MHAREIGKKKICCPEANFHACNGYVWRGLISQVWGFAHPPGPVHAGLEQPYTRLSLSSLCARLGGDGCHLLQPDPFIFSCLTFKAQDWVVLLPHVPLAFLLTIAVFHGVVVNSPVFLPSLMSADPVNCSSPCSRHAYPEATRRRRRRAPALSR
jgi:hypothetical protein